MEHYILCASIFMCIALHFARQAALSAGIPPVSVCSPEIRELGVYYPPVSVLHLVATRGQGLCLQGYFTHSYVLTVFLFAGFSSDKYVLPVYMGLGPKLHTCIFITVYVTSQIFKLKYDVIFEIIRL